MEEEVKPGVKFTQVEVGLESHNCFADATCNLWVSFCLPLLCWPLVSLWPCLALLVLGAVLARGFSAPRRGG